MRSADVGAPYQEGADLFFAEALGRPAPGQLARCLASRWGSDRGVVAVALGLEVCSSRGHAAAGLASPQRSCASGTSTPDRVSTLLWRLTPVLHEDPTAQIVVLCTPDG